MFRTVTAVICEIRQAASEQIWLAIVCAAISKVELFQFLKPCQLSYMSKVNSWPRVLFGRKWYHRAVNKKCGRWCLKCVNLHHLCLACRDAAAWLLDLFHQSCLSASSSEPVTHLEPVLHFLPTNQKKVWVLVPNHTDTGNVLYLPAIGCHILS